MKRSNYTKMFRIFIPFFLLIFCLPAMANEAEGDRTPAYEFLRSMGRGANLMASKIEGRHHSNHDFQLLAENHFTHCRIGGKLNLHHGAGPDYNVDADRIADLKEAADFCLANGLIAVIDPLHLYNEHFSDDQLPVLEKIWEQVAIAFADYPVDRLAFEIMNEPHNGYNLKNIIHKSLAAIRKVPGNEERIVIASGQGFTTRMALIKAFQNDIFPTDDNYLIGTFHYYDPKSFTKQGTFGVTTQWGQSGVNDPAWAVVEDAFDEVVEANQQWADRHQTQALPVYLGEYGVDNQAPKADRKRWLCWIRMQAEKRGFSTALWNMYNLNSKGIGPWTREQRDDPSTRYLQEEMVEVLMTRYEMEEAETTGGIQSKQFTQNYSGEGYADFSTAMKGDNALLKSIYIPKSDTYTVTFRYRNASQENALVDLAVYDGNSNLVAEKKQVAFLPSGQDDGWSKFVVELDFEVDPESILQLTCSSGTDALLIDYLCISLGEYYDFLYPSKLETSEIPTAIEEPTGLLDRGIRVYPTLFSEYTTIYANLKSNETVVFQVNDLLGKSIQNGYLNESMGAVSIGHEYQDGCFLLNLRGKDWRNCVKLIKQSKM
ncbi:MAG: cellulase family glycosylhydrolase [Marinifilaceae bacterium]